MKNKSANTEVKNELMITEQETVAVLESMMVIDNPSVLKNISSHFDKQNKLLEAYTIALKEKCIKFNELQEINEDINNKLVELEAQNEIHKANFNMANKDLNLLVNTLLSFSNYISILVRFGNEGKNTKKVANSINEKLIKIIEKVLKKGKWCN